MNKLQEVTPTDIMDAVREYSADKSVMDEASDIPADFNLLTDETIKIHGKMFLSKTLPPLPTLIGASQSQK